MSIALILQQHLDAGRLVELRSSFWGAGARTMIVTPDILRVVTPPFDQDEERALRLSEFRQSLDSFSECGFLTVAEDPRRKPPDAMMARVEPVEKEFFSLRITDPQWSPGIRSLGGFSDYDAFVALTWDLRENIELFDDEVAIVEAAWKGLFGDIPPYSGGHLDDYLSNAISV